MIRPILLLTASVAVSITLAGCTGHATKHPQPQAAVAGIESAAVVPVFIVPTCKVLGGKQYCQWMEPRGYQQSSEPVHTNARINGIAL